MRYGPDKVIACPKCGRALRKKVLWSASLIQATYWTDGKIQAAMCPELPFITRCSHCQGIFWVDNAKEIGEIKYINFAPDPNQGAWVDAPIVANLDESELLEAMTSTSAKGKLRKLRIELWRLLNNPYRSGCEEPYSEVFEHNLNELVTMLKDDKPTQRVLKAEALRELGHHGDALELLGEVAPKVSRLASRITDLARHGGRRVAKLSLERKPYLQGVA